MWGISSAARALVAAALIVTMAVTMAAASAQDISNANLDAENEAQRDKIRALLKSHNTSWAVAWVPDPIFGPIAGYASWQINLGLKTVRPVLQPPPDKAVLPNSGDGCSYRLDYTHNVNEVYTDYLGLGPAFNPGAPRLDASWGALGQPTVYHGNSDVRVETRLDSQPFGLPGSQSGSASVLLPVGRHTVGYSATTQISDLLDVPPWFALEMLLPLDVARKSLGRQLLEAAIVGGVLNYGPSAINSLAAKGGIGSIEPRDTFATSERLQRFWVLDTVYPVLDILEPAIQLEAINVGGRVLTRELEAQVRESTVHYTDRCREPNELDIRLRAPQFLPVGQDIEVEWRLRDPGPSTLDPVGEDPDFPDGRSDDRRNEVRTLQVWQIRDTLAPIIEPPRGRVLETNAASEDVPLGRPAVFDLADPEARVAPSIGGTPVESETVELASPSRTQVTWTATDASGNTSDKSQWITLKPLGSNTAPAAMAGAASAVSFEDVRIELLASDADLIDGRYDQLAFAISEPPANGELVAPLFPFFIEDYRIEANLPEDIQQQGDTDGDGLINPLELQALFLEWCEDPVRRLTPLPRDLVREPVYIAVTDDGTTFVLDRVTRCNQADPTTDPRIAQFDAEGNLVAEIDFPVNFFNLMSFSIGPDGNLYLKDPDEPNVWRIDPTPVPDGNGPPEMLSTRLALNPPPDDMGLVRNVDNIRSAAVDENGLLTVTDGFAAYVFDITRPQSAGNLDSVLFVGDLVPGGAFGDDASGDLHMDTAIDSAGNVYFSDEEQNRVYKYSPSTLDRATDTFVPGEQIGWMGRCAGNLTEVPACDTASQRSFGFACSDALCAVDTGPRDVTAERAACELPPGDGVNNRRAGCGAGQFDRPLGIAISGDDILYVADYNNLRIQRFDTNGMFGGEARSECDGRCFVLGDFGRPVDVSVNRTHFYVLDTEFDLLHVFETTPVTNVEDANLNVVQNAFVTYRSDNNFRGTDTFSFVASDGLADSTPATVSVDVARNFRPPEASANIRVTTPEDESVDVTLVGTDPDGDTLGYTIVRQPGHGRLEGNPPNLRYVPDPNFEGPDSFAFVVDDSLTSVPAMSSAPAEVTVEVLPSPDLPALTMELAERTGVGYDTLLSIHAFDPDVGDVLSVTIEWGDGSLPQAATRDLQAVGIHPVMFEDARFEARVEGTHAYGQPGEYTVRVCAADHIGDGTLGSCDDDLARTVLTQTILVEELVDLVVHTTDDLEKFEEPQCPPEIVAAGNCPLRSAPVIDGNSVTYTAIINHVQLGELEAPATNVTARFDFPPELVPGSVSVDAGGAASSSNITGSAVEAVISTVPPGGQARVSVTVSTPGTVIGERAVVVAGEVTSDTPDPGGRNPIAARTVIAMDPAGDIDGDGVLNGEDAFPGDPLESVDTDSDGIGDNGDLDDDGDALPDSWERRYGFDEKAAGDELGDGDGDGVLNGEEYANGTRPDSNDSDRDGWLDGNDNCAAGYNRLQYDLDADDRGDLCDADQASFVAAFGDLGGSGAPDFALVRTDGGTADAFFKDGDSNVSVGANTIRLSDGGGTEILAIAAIAASGDDTLAVLDRDAGGQARLRLWDARSGAALGSTSVFGASVFDASGSPPGLAGLSRTGGGELVAIANTATESIAVERRRVDDLTAGGTVGLLAGYGAVGIAAVNGGGHYGVLAVELASGMLELVLVSSANDAIERRWTIAGSEWVSAKVTPSGAGFAVLHQDLAGTINVTVLDAADDAPVATFEVLNDAWTALGIAAADDALAVLAASDDGELRVALLARADGSLRNEQSFHSDDDAPRQLLASGADIGVLASDAMGAVTFDVHAADGGDARLLTAEATSPPPPPPPPPPAGGGDGGGGGGAVGILWLLGMAGHGCRRRRQSRLPGPPGRRDPARWR